MVTNCDGLEDSESSGLEVGIHLTGNGQKRLPIGAVLDDILDPGRGPSLRETPPSTWVYISGPHAFIEEGDGFARDSRDGLSGMEPGGIYNGIKLYLLRPS